MTQNQLTGRTAARGTGTAPAMIPTTLWAAGPTPIDPHDPWPPRLLTRAVLEYSRPGDRVMLLPDASTPTTSTLAELGRTLVPATTDPDESVPVADTDLILTTLLPEPEPHTVPEAVQTASARLRVGGLLIVFSRCSHDSDGHLRDFSGHLVSAAQHCDLLYLQHLIAAPVHGTAIVAAPTHPGTPCRIVGGPNEHNDIIHTDVSVFLQPHDLTTAA
ncbi:hypothetical protein [Nocardia terpenica]|uniref:Class I SAM-dependent methyltransferase n=1 Tax=Nocardia terpenica TaxID=455432 RepID=A0A164IUC7_9NOCA|nr:hypothetical protein [Nocardia terpenica]KZM69755.1 hypothetical protein AWN90_06945 [Nocardia terpenica]NQE89468.1 hypothetical protein [Nocardia terpenica]